jgi:hypothetical protein
VHPRSSAPYQALVALSFVLAAGAAAQTATKIIDSTGDGNGNTLGGAFDVAVDASGNVYVTGHYTNNAFKIAALSAVPAAHRPFLTGLLLSLGLVGIAAVRRRRTAPGTWDRFPGIL